MQKFIYDGANVVVEYDSNNTLLATYLTPGLDENLSMPRNSATYYYHQNALGSIRNITDTSEVAQNTYDYYAFGSSLNWSQNITNRYTFTAREWDSEASLYHYRARQYAAHLGRFTARDPIGTEGGINLYLYVANNPPNYTDPSGLIRDIDEKEWNKRKKGRQIESWPLSGVGVGVHCESGTAVKQKVIKEVSGAGAFYHPLFLPDNLPVQSTFLSGLGALVAKVNAHIGDDKYYGGNFGFYLYDWYKGFTILHIYAKASVQLGEYNDGGCCPPAKRLHFKEYKQVYP